jgi:hypothetical protein
VTEESRTSTPDDFSEKMVKMADEMEKRLGEPEGAIDALLEGEIGRSSSAVTPSSRAQSP